jgi:hypothetical protein
MLYATTEPVNVLRVFTVTPLIRSPFTTVAEKTRSAGERKISSLTWLTVKVICIRSRFFWERTDVRAAYISK